MKRKRAGLTDSRSFCLEQTQFCIRSATLLWQNYLRFSTVLFQLFRFNDDIIEFDFKLKI
jgi:hypothetical protein